MISRAAAHFILNDLNITTFYELTNALVSFWSNLRAGTIFTLSRQPYGGDEVFFTSLSATDAIRLPGGYTSKCSHLEEDSIMR